MGYYYRHTKQAKKGIFQNHVEIHFGNLIIGILVVLTVVALPIGLMEHQKNQPVAIAASTDQVTYNNINTQVATTINSGRVAGISTTQDNIIIAIIPTPEFRMAMGVVIVIASAILFYYSARQVNWRD